MERMQAHQHRQVPGLFRVRGLDLGAEAAPELRPSSPVARQKRVEASGAGGRLLGVGGALGDGPIAQGVEGDHLLDRESRPLAEFQLEGRADVACLLGDLGGGARDRDAVDIEFRPRRLGDVDVRLHGACLEDDDTAPALAREDRLQMLLVELGVALDAVVDEPPVEGGTHLHRARPVLRREVSLQGGEMGLRHVHQAAVDQPTRAAVGVLKTEVAVEHAFLQVELLAEMQDLHVRKPEPEAAVDTEG